VTELIIVATDLYLASGSASAAPTQLSLPGLARLVRFGRIRQLPRDWRSELASSLGRSDLASLTPAAVAAIATPPTGRAHPPTNPFFWFADPIHVAASLTSVHLMPHGLLRLDEPTQAQLCGAFNAAFAEVGYELTATHAGRFLASGPALVGEIETTDPARCLGASLENALPRGSGAAALRRLGAEIEMWLHDHPLNMRRAAARRAPISTLWLWGGGVPLAPLARQMARSTTHNGAPSASFFSDDAYVEGLVQLLGMHCAPPPPTLAGLTATSERRIVVTLELFTAGEAHSFDAATPLAALEAFDRQWLEPALDELARGSLARCTLIANDRRVSFASRDRWRLWRHSRGALAALAAGAATEP
jgi:hypothetical protein